MDTTSVEGKKMTTFNPFKPSRLNELQSKTTNRVLPLSYNNKLTKAQFKTTISYHRPW